MRKARFRTVRKKGETMEFLSSIFHPIVELMTTLVTYAFQLTQMVGYPSYGVAIILLTIVIQSDFGTTYC